MTSNSPVVTFCDRHYIPVLENFLAAPGAPDASDLIVYGLDDETLACAEDAGATARPLAWDGSLDGLWEERLRVFRDLVASGSGFIHSDVDAIWLRDPRGAWSSDDVDMAFSAGTIHPKAVHATWGFVLCCGYFQMNATAGSARLLDLALEAFQASRDDQDTINALLLQQGTEWPDAPSPDYRLRASDTSFSCWKRPVTGQCRALGLTVRLLPHGIVQRIHDPMATGREICIRHPLSLKEGDEKMQTLRELGLVFTDGDAGKTG